MKINELQDYSKKTLLKLLKIFDLDMHNLGAGDKKVNAMNMVDIVLTISSNFCGKALNDLYELLEPQLTIEQRNEITKRCLYLIILAIDENAKLRTKKTH